MKLRSTNAFSYSLPDLSDVVSERRTGRYVRRRLEACLAAIAVPRAHISVCVRDILRLTCNKQDVFAREGAIHDLLLTITSQEKLAEALGRRSLAVASEIVPHLRAGSIFDFGCGDGRIAACISQTHGGTILLGDTYEHPTVRTHGFNFSLLPASGPVSVQQKFDNVLLCTVAHHSDTPDETLREAVRLCAPGGRVVLIESVFDVNKVARGRKWNQPTREFLELSASEQFGVNMFFDHFYNRCLYYSPNPALKVNVPFNFRSPKRWEEACSNMGARKLEMIALGIDLDIAPLFHVLLVAEPV